MRRFTLPVLVAVLAATACDTRDPLGLHGDVAGHVSGPGDNSHNDMRPTITAPTGADPLPEGTVIVTWSAPLEGIDRYGHRIEKETAAGVWQLVPGSDGTTTLSVRTFTSPALDAGNYRVYVSGEKGTPGASNHHGATTVRGFTVATITATDNTPPTYECSPPDASIWHALDVTVACTASDDSGLAVGSPSTFQLTTSVSAGTETATAQTGTQVLSDIHGNEVTVGPFTFMIDRKAPVVTCTPGNQAIWYGSNQSVACTANDGGSGLADAADAGFSLSTSVNTGDETVSANTGSRMVADRVGNSAVAGHYTFKIDRKAPVVTCNAPAPSFILNQTGAFVTATAVDGGSGPASASASAAASTAEVGSSSVIVYATDDVGNSGSASCSFSVGYHFVGFERPVENGAVLNRVKAGQAIPLKWRLLDANGSPVLDLVSVEVRVSALSCAVGTSADLWSETAAGSSGLQNLGDGHYQFNWKSPTSYASSCKTLNLNMGEESPRSALFQFTK
jgi:hypothetical protein